MAKYIIVKCEHNLKDCVNSWRIQLTEYGLCVVYIQKQTNSTASTSTKKVLTLRLSNKLQTDQNVD